MHYTSEGSPGSLKPTDVVSGVKLLYMSLLLGIVSAVLDFRSEVALSSAVQVVTTIVVTSGLLLFLIVKISDGRNWARITFLILYLLGLGVSLPFLYYELRRSPMGGFMFILQSLLQTVALFFLFKRSSGVWFKRGTSTA